MDIVTIESSILNDTNVSCSTPLLWTQQAIDSRKSRLYTCIVASLIHGIFWLQLLFCSSVRQKSMQWIYAYLVTDVFLLFRFFFIYIIRTTSTECEPNESWRIFICYFEALVDNYLNILEVYILLALNICRYIQIRYNRNVYRLHRKYLILTHLFIYFLPLFFLIIQFSVGWSQVIEYPRDNCDVNYTNTYIQIFNIISCFALPISLNILVIYTSIRHIHLTSQLGQNRHYVSAREKYHRSLVFQFLIFYAIWLLLWSPNVIIFQLSVSSNNLTIIVRLLNFIEIALDPIIIAALDVRFWQAWKKFGRFLRANFLGYYHRRRIQPTAAANTTTTAFTIKTPRLQTTKF